MLRFFAAIVLVSLTSLPACGLEWLTDLPTALDKGKREDKNVLVDFTGSDWCPWCKRLQTTVFDQPRFAEYAEANLVLLRVDFPHNQTLPRVQQRANQDLKNSFGVRSFPTVYLVSPEGMRQDMFSGDFLHGPDAFIHGMQFTKSHFGPKPATPAPVVPEPTSIPAVPRTYRPPGPIRPVNYGALKLKSISGANDRRIVLINNASLMVGETAKIRSDGKDVQVTCNAIHEDAVLITCEGKRMELKLGAK
jgi:thioredoxin-related protein